MEWSCKAQLPLHLEFGKIEVNCEVSIVFRNWLLVKNTAQMFLTGVVLSGL